MRDYSVNHSSAANPKPSKKPIAYLGLVLLGMGMGIGGTYAVSNPQGFARLSESAMVAPQSAVETPAAIAGIPAPSNFVVDVVKETGPGDRFSSYCQ